MSYQVLARKWRPKIFSEVVGQEHVLKILSNSLSLGRIHHAYLFSGTRGVGKTSIARLLAKGLNCEQGITATPCGVCDNCRDIEQGRFVDLLEIDAASRTKVEDTREILDNIQYLPTKGRFKVYLIDEVHMLSRSSFNALLKTLEEPPEHVKFLLATTDPQKLPITILSRCLHLHLNVLDTTLICGQLMHILQVEHIDAKQKAIQLIAKAANGSMRDALSLTDQAIALGNGQIDDESVQVMLGTLDKSIPFSLVEALYQADGSALMQQLEIAARQGADWDTLLAETIGLLHQLALLQVIPTAIGEYQDNEEKIRFLAQHIAPNDVQLFYQILLMGRKELAFAPDKKMGVEMSFLRALAFMPKNASGQQVERSVNTSPVNKAVQPANTQVVTRDFSPKKSVEADHLAAQHQVSTFKNQTVTDSTSAAALSDTERDMQVVSNDASSITKNVLEMRQKLINSELKNSKKSEPVDHQIVAQAQPKARSPRVMNTKASITETKPAPAHTIDHVAQQDHAEEDDEITAENYQWQATHFVEPKEHLDTKSFKASLSSDKTAEMTQKLIDEMAAKDAWCYEIEQLDIAPLIKQIAINSFVEQRDDSLVLHMRSQVKHLLNSSNNITKLENALSRYRQTKLTLSVVIDDDPSTQTPLEKREALYLDKLAQAKQAVNQDEKVSMICQFFEAQIDEASLRPV